MKRNNTGKSRSSAQQRGALRDLFAIAEEVRGSPPLLVMPTPVQSRILDASCYIRQDTQPDVLYQHSLLCQTGLPARQPSEGVRFWERRQGRVT